MAEDQDPVLFDVEYYDFKKPGWRKRKEYYLEGDPAIQAEEMIKNFKNVQPWAIRKKGRFR